MISCTVAELDKSGKQVISIIIDVNPLIRFRNLKPILWATYITAALQCYALKVMLTL